jgi:hypothetical protein
MLQVRDGSVSFGALEDVGPRTTTRDVTFAAPITQFAAVLTGFAVRYSRGADHNLGQLDVNLRATLLPGSSTTVRVTVTYGLRDEGDYDDEYEGVIRFAVVGE